MSQLLKRWLEALGGRDRSDRKARAREIYRRLDLGPSGTFSGAAVDSRRAARDALVERHRRHDTG